MTDFDTSVFRNLSHHDELALIRRVQEWHRSHAGSRAANVDPACAGAVSAPVSSPPEAHELVSVTVHLVAPTIDAFGSEAQRERFVEPFRRAEELCCQLFSEPGAGSDLGSVSTRATRDRDTWVVSGQKVWSSGAMFAGWGELIARTDPSAPKHRGLTAFLVPMDSAGVEVRAIRQMSGGASFGAVFLDDVRIPDALRLGPVGDGWKVALTTLGFERATSGAGGAKVGGSADQVRRTAHHHRRAGDPIARQDIARVVSDERIRDLNERRRLHGSIGKLQWTDGMARIAAAVSHVVGVGLTADSGQPASYTWLDHVLGAPGYRIAGGTDEIQRNIIGERVLGLPR